jgi:hypothetical protein
MTSRNFVESILDDSAPLMTSSRVTSQQTSAADGGLPLTQLVKSAAVDSSPPSPMEKRYESLNDNSVVADEDGDALGDQFNAKTHAMFRYALLFINFTLVVAALLMIMAGVVARFNAAVRLCPRCGELTLSVIIFGGALWLLTMFAFNWIRQRNILFLLGYVAAVIVIAIALLVIFITAIAYDSEMDDVGGQQIALQQWRQEMSRNDTTTGMSSLCALQRQYNCSGFGFGCCAASNVCYNMSQGVPAWHREVCPSCPGQPATPVMCTDVVTATVRRNLSGFMIIIFFALVLMFTAIALAVFARKMNQ